MLMNAHLELRIVLTSAQTAWVPSNAAADSDIGFKPDGKTCTGNL